MKLDRSGAFACYSSKNLALSCAGSFPFIAYLGVESGGRQRTHLDNNLLKPTGGMAVVNGKASSFDSKAEAQADGGGISWRKFKIGKKTFSLAVKFGGNRKFDIKITAEDGELSGCFFRMDFAPGISPSSVWSRPRGEAKEIARGEGKMFDFPVLAREMEVPLAVHFPDYGLMRVTAREKHVYSRVVFEPSQEYAGLTHGYANAGGHVSRQGYHEGTVRLEFHAGKKCKKATLHCEIDKEHYPRVKGCDFSDQKWAGLRRCWMNTFALNPFEYSMGDNILLGGNAHLSVNYKSDQSLFTPPFFKGFAVHDVFRSVMERSFTDSQAESGEVNWMIKDGRKKEPGQYGWIDCTPSNMIAFRNYVVATGDLKFAKKLKGNLLKAADFMASLDRDGDGILEVPFHGNSMHVKGDERVCRNWWDDFAFGWKDAYTNLLTYRAWGFAAEVCEKLGDEKSAEKLEGYRKAFAKSFHKIFYNPETGVYAGWISRDGKIHDPMFTFVSAMAINEGLVPKARGKKILTKMLKRLDEAGFNIRYGIPGPLYPLPENDRGTWAPMSDWGRYEHGGHCGQTAYHFLQALYNCDMKKEADEILFAMLDTFENEPTHNGLHPGYFKSWDWRAKDGRPCGYNYLADNYYFLLAAITGHYGVKL